MREWRPLTRPERLVLDVLAWALAVMFIAEAWVVNIPAPWQVVMWMVGLPAGLVLWYDNCRRVGMRPWKDRPRA